MAEEDWRVCSQAAAILSFYLTNPDAVETLEGIVEWRLMEEIIRRRVSDTHGALQWLVECGYLTRIERSGGEPLYQLVPEKRLDAARFVSQMTADTVRAASDRPSDE